MGLKGEPIAADKTNKSERPRLHKWSVHLLKKQTWIKDVNQILLSFGLPVDGAVQHQTFYLTDCS